jgi:hypothetical protein
MPFSLSVRRSRVGERRRSQRHRIWRTRNESDVKDGFQELSFLVLSGLKVKKKIARKEAGKKLRSAFSLTIVYITYVIYTPNIGYI